MTTSGGWLDLGGRLFINSGGEVALDHTDVTSSMVLVERSGSALTVTGADVEAGDRFGGFGETGRDISVTLTDSSLATDWIEFDKSMQIYDNTWVQSRDVVWYRDSSISQNGGELLFADSMLLGDGSQMTLEEKAGSRAVIRHQDSPQDSDNWGDLSVDASSLSLTRSDLDLSSGAVGWLRVHNGSEMTGVESTFTSGAMTLDTGSQAALTGSTVTTGEMNVTAGSALTLDNSTIDTGASGWLRIQGNSRLQASRNSQLGVGGQLLVQDGSLVQLADTTVAAESVWVEHTGSAIAMTGGHLTARTNIGIGNIGTPSGALELNGTEVTTGDLSVLGRFSANGSVIDAGTSFRGFGQNGTAADVVLDSSSLQAVHIDFNKSQHSYRDATVTALDNIWYWNSTVEQNGGQIVFADEMILIDGAAMTVQGSSVEAAVVRHQAAAGEPDNRGDLGLDDSSLALNYADVDIASGDSGLLRVHNGGQLTAVDSRLAANRVWIETGGQAELTRGSLTADSLWVDSGSTFSETAAAINILGNTTNIAEGGSMTLNGGVFSEAGDFIVNGALAGNGSVIDVGFDFLLNDCGTATFSGPAELSVGDDFILSALGLSGSDFSQLTLRMLGSNDDELNGSVFDSATALGSLIVETSLTLLGDLIVDHLDLTAGLVIDLNGFSLNILSSLAGDSSLILGDSWTGPEPGAPVPEPSTLLLVGGGLLGLAWLRRRK